jgi:hypothetical protein
VRVRGVLSCSYDVLAVTRFWPLPTSGCARSAPSPLMAGTHRGKATSEVRRGGEEAMWEV